MASTSSNKTFFSIKWRVQESHFNGQITEFVTLLITLRKIMGNIFFSWDGLK
jgi:hypothetical protein